MTESQGSYKVSLCRKTTCCPQLIIDENNQYIITDDFEGKVVLQEEHIDELIRVHQAKQEEMYKAIAFQIINDCPSCSDVIK